MRRFIRRLQAFRRRDQIDRDIEDEMAFHLAMKEEENGDSAAIHREFGNKTALKESCRDLYIFSTLEILWHDFRYAFRSLARRPVVTWVAIVALALGLGANTTVFTVVSSALSFGMGVDHIERLVTLTPGDGLAGERASQVFPAFGELASAKIWSIDHLAAYRGTQVNVSDRRALPEQYFCVRMTASGWDFITRPPALGRRLSHGDEAPNAAPVVVLSHRVWQNRYGADPSILGKAVRVDGTVRVIVGVMPPDVTFPEAADLWMPLSTEDLFAGGGMLLVFGRLADHATLAGAISEADAIVRRLAPMSPAGSRGLLVTVRPFLEIIGVYGARRMLVAAVFAVGFVLLIVCADVANLLLAQAAGRGREISIRIAVGAGRVRIIRQLLIESVLLAIGGGLAGWAVAVLGLHWFDALTARTTRPPWIDFTMNIRAFEYLAAISIGAGIVFGLAPALRLANTDVHGAMKDGGPSAGSGMRGQRLANWLVASQMALCVLLLAGAGLLIHSSLNLYNAPLVVDASHVLTMRVSLPAAKYARSEQQTSFYSALRTKLESLPGVQAVSFVSDLPMGGLSHFRAEREGPGLGDDSRAPMLDAVTAGGDYFRVMQVPLRSGYPFSDNPGASGEVIVNESFAAQFWPGESPLGKRLRRSEGNPARRWLTVIGVVPDIPQDFAHPLDRGPLVYLNFAEEQPTTTFVVARTTVPPAALSESFRRVLRDLDGDLPAQAVDPLPNRIARRRLDVTSFGLLFTIFAAIAVVLASIGLYGVVAQAVSRRTQEIGIRMAIGARRADLFTMVLSQGMRNVALGIAAGLPLAFGVTRVLRGSLVGVSPIDPLTFTAVVVVLALAGLAGCALPARRATRVEPQAALRLE